VAFVVDKAALGLTGDVITTEATLWAAMMLLSAGALVTMIALRRKELKR
jgi:hypothetical protein